MPHTVKVDQAAIAVFGLQIIALYPLLPLPLALRFFDPRHPCGRQVALQNFGRLAIPPNEAIRG